MLNGWLVNCLANPKPREMKKYRVWAESRWGYNTSLDIYANSHKDAKENANKENSKLSPNKYYYPYKSSLIN